MSEPSPRLSYLIGRLDRALSAAIVSCIAPYGVSVPEYTALSVLKRAPGLSNAQLARRTLVRPQSMFQVIVSLEKADLIRREPSEHHSRVLRATLTPAGRKVLNKCDKEISRLEDRFLQDIELAEREQLRARFIDFAVRLESIPLAD